MLFYRRCSYVNQDVLFLYLYLHIYITNVKTKHLYLYMKNYEERAFKR